MIISLKRQFLNYIFNYFRKNKKYLKSSTRKLKVKGQTWIKYQKSSQDKPRGQKMYFVKMGFLCWKIEAVMVKRGRRGNTLSVVIYSKIGNILKSKKGWGKTISWQDCQDLNCGLKGFCGHMYCTICDTEEDAGSYKNNIWHFLGQ